MNLRAPEEGHFLIRCSSQEGCFTLVVKPTRTTAIYHSRTVKKPDGGFFLQFKGKELEVASLSKLAQKLREEWHFIPIPFSPFDPPPQAIQKLHVCCFSPPGDETYTSTRILEKKTTLNQEDITDLLQTTRNTLRTQQHKSARK